MNREAFEELLNNAIKSAEGIGYSHGCGYFGKIDANDEKDVAEEKLLAEFDRLTAEKWGQVRCEECRFSVDADGWHIEGTAPEGAIRCEKEKCPLEGMLVPEDFGCVLGEPIQSIGSEVV